MNEYKNRKAERFTLMYRCGKHENKGNDRPSSACPVCMVSEKQATAKIAGRMADVLGKKRRNKSKKGN